MPSPRPPPPPSSAAGHRRSREPRRPVSRRSFLPPPDLHSAPLVVERGSPPDRGGEQRPRLRCHLTENGCAARLGSADVGVLGAPDRVVADPGGQLLRLLAEPPREPQDQAA